MKRQTYLFDEAKSLVLVRVDREGKATQAQAERDNLQSERVNFVKPVLGGRTGGGLFQRSPSSQ